jgi:hypothetical protein
LPISLQVGVDYIERIDMGEPHRTLTSDGAAILENALAGFNCALEEIFAALWPRSHHWPGTSYCDSADGHPLLYWHGTYQQIVQKQTN